MKFLIFIIVSLSLLLNLSCSDAQSFEPELLWADEFNDDGLPDSEFWSYEEGYKRNSELQYYTNARKENARVENGVLILEARNDDWKGHEITSASVHTYGKKSILYGRVEVKAKIPSSLGTWPAIWMLGNSIKTGTGWPACGEIDIMEHVGYDPNVVHANIHTKAYNHVTQTGKGNSLTVENPHEDFHIYAMNWYPDKIEFFFDGHLYFTFHNENKTNAEWPFDKPQYLILNFAFGGGWGGKQGVDKTKLPLQYLIDYVRVYKL